MGTVATDTSNGKTFTPAPAGSHRAVCIGVIDLGHHTSEYQGKVKCQHKVLLTFELVDELMEDERPFTLSRTFTLSLFERALLRQFLDNWRGTPFTEEDLKGWDVKNVLGVPCMLSVTHAKKDDRTYANIGAASKLPKGMTAPESTANPIRHYDIDSREIPEWLPLWIARRIRESQEYKQNDFDDRGPVGEGEAKPERKPAEAAARPAGAVDPDDDDCPF